MSVDIDPYAVLGVLKDATLPEIKSAHRKLVLRCHPDKIKDESLRNEAQGEFQRVQQAYELLSDDSRRTKYDQKVRLAELRREVKEHQRSYSSPRTSNSREYRDGRIYEERTPADSYFDEESHPSARKYDDFGRRPRPEEKKKPKATTTGTNPFSTFRAARDAARDSTKTSHSTRAKCRTKERRREVYEKHERGTYVDPDSDSSTSSAYVRAKQRPTSSTRRTNSSDPRRYEEDDYSDAYYESKHDKLHTTARDYIRRSKGSLPAEVDSRNRPSRSPPPPRARDHESAEPERRSGGTPRSKHPSRETVRPSSSRNGSYEHLDTPHQPPPRAYEGVRVPSMPTATTSPAAAKVPSSSAARPQPSRSATTTAGFSRSGTKRDPLQNMVYGDGSARSPKVRPPERHDSGYSSPGTPEMGAGTSPPKTATRYKIVSEPDAIVIEPDAHPPSSSRHPRGYSPSYMHSDRPPIPVRSKPVRSHTSFVPEPRYEKAARPSSSARQLFGEFTPRKEKDIKYAREYGPDDVVYPRDPHPRSYPYEEHRHRRQSTYA